MQALSCHLCWAPSCLPVLCRPFGGPFVASDHGASFEPRPDSLSLPGASLGPQPVPDFSPDATACTLKAPAQSPLHNSGRRRQGSSDKSESEEDFRYANTSPNLQPESVSLFISETALPPGAGATRRRPCPAPLGPLGDEDSHLAASTARRSRSRRRQAPPRTGRK